MEPIMLPALYCPFESQLNPHAQAVQQQMVNWIWDQGLITDQVAFDRFCAANIGKLAALTHPLVAQEGLQIVADWCAWLFIFDDICDNTELGRNPQQLATYHNSFIEILTGAAIKIIDTPIAHTLFDLRQRTISISTHEQWNRFVTRIEECFEGCLWEAKNRSNKTSPDVFTYMERRPYIGGLYAYIELMSITSRINLPCTAQYHEHIYNLTRLANRSVCWANDLLSFSQEKLQGDMHNIVLIIQKSYRISLPEAIYHTSKLYNSDMTRFIDILSYLQLYDLSHQYVALLQSLMIGYLDWSYQSPRYQLIERVISNA